MFRHDEAARSLNTACDLVRPIPVVPYAVDHKDYIGDRFISCETKSRVEPEPGAPQLLARERDF
jgi:hypothetical protein